MNELNAELFEKTLNEILPNLTMYVRDVNLNNELEDKYIPDTIIKERGFTDASSKVMGMKTTHRFAILSNHMADLGKFEQGENRGLFVAASDSHFLILDKYKYHGKTQIVLLHLPDDIRWEMFRNVRITALDDIITDTRKIFENKCEQKVIPELATNEWLDRCSAPLGMDDDGNLFELDFIIEKKLRKIGETNFRNLYHRIVYVKSTPELKKSLSKDIEIIGEDDGFLAYGYIDDQAGFSFLVFCSANIRNNKLSRGIYNQEVGIIIRRGAINECQYLDLDYCSVDTSDFEEIISFIDENYKCQSSEKEEMRTFGFLDELRNTDYPDDIQVILIKDELYPEQVWVRCSQFTDNELYGILLNEPNQDFGIHMGSVIGFAPVQNENGILCVFTGKVL